MSRLTESTRMDIERLVRRQAKTLAHYDRAVEEAIRLASRVRRPLTAEDAAYAAVSKTDPRCDRLGHGTGAENWL